MVVDQPGWAHDFKSKQLALHLRSEFRIRTVYQDALTGADVADADVILLYYWMQWAVVGSLCAHRQPHVLMGVCSHFELGGAWREPGLATLNDAPGAVFVNNLKLYAELRPLVRRPLFYTPNGVDTRFFRPAPRAPKAVRFRAGWAGSLLNQNRAHRGFDDFIAPAVARVDGAELVTAAREDRWRTRRQMRDFYRSLDAYVCASESEGTPNPCLEASACGVPVVTTAVGNMPEFIRDGENGFVVARDVEQFADRLRLLASDRQLAQSMGAQARRAAEHWNWAAQARRYADMFRAVLGGRLQAIAPSPGDREALTLVPAFLHRGGGESAPQARPLIWGAGEAGRRLAGRLSSLGVEALAFVDSDPLKAGTVWAGRPVRGAAEVLASRSGEPIIVASVHADAIRLRLVEAGYVEFEHFLVIAAGLL
jgi:hypothetical protein